ncbi:hypothetical protein Clacol_001368 [Clathrus columnatus]|uniref:GTP cyclohydrolase II n=1 Tax=Clathrus columnatus TaxID=1419009 RepID=A0AAV5A3F1_9AGAM|nr:hypothetical protein Clacol_001368 [Clathrus columnatus]
MNSDKWRRREAPLDPLLLAAAVASGPHVTRHHYHHVGHTGIDPEMINLLLGEEVHDDEAIRAPPPRYVSRQAPRSQRLKDELSSNDQTTTTTTSSILVTSPTDEKSDNSVDPPPPVVKLVDPPAFDPVRQDIQVQCLSRARIPTPHGPVFLHLYRNNRDDKEHLAIVVDAEERQHRDASDSESSDDGEDHFDDLPHIISRSLNNVWNSHETKMDRLVRGAQSKPFKNKNKSSSLSLHNHQKIIPPSLVRIHSECYTGEIIGSMRCDCGSQLSEAIRLMSLQGRGVVVYLRQEGRGIGLLSKLRAYNLQDMGHDTVTANLALGHGADERRYGIATAILDDLGIHQIRLLTNNPEKVIAMATEGINIVERVPMIPPPQTRSEDLDKYLRTKIDKMGHMLSL